ncbi:MAG TPA: TonB C-terminal domain-containing protein [Gemmatimonadaceae bacterium]
MGVPLVASALLHGAVVAAALLLRGEPAPPMPPTYRVNLVAAPPGPRAIGVVRPPDPAPAPEPAAAPKPAPARPVTESPDMAPAPTRKAPAKAPPRATATAPTTAKPAKEAPKPSALPRAGGGPVGGTGTDVATVRTEGIEFPYPGYLENIVRQIALRFKPPRGANLRADVVFILRRDGTISNLRFLKSSGSYAFDLEARGAVEAAAEAQAFGPLPRAFPDDALPVIFSFDPRLIR